VEDHEALETSALVSQLADAVEGQVNQLLADGVVTTGVVVGGILLARDHLLRVEQVAVTASADLIHNSRLQIYHQATGNVLAGASLGEEGVSGLIARANSAVSGQLAIRLDTVLEAQKLPACHTGLHTGLAQMDRNTFTHVD